MDTNTDSAPALEAEGAQLRALAVAEDSGNPVEIQQPAADHGGPAEQDGASEQGANGGSDAATSPKTDKPGTALPSDKGTQPPAKKEQPAQEESAYARLKKDQARLARNRQEHQAEREQFLREREQLQREREEFERQRTTPPPAEKSPLAEFSEEALAQYAEDAEADGRHAQAARARAEIERRKAQPPPAPQRQQGSDPVSQERFVAAWKGNLETLTKENPDLGNPQSELYQETAGILKARPILHTYPDGIKDAVTLAKLQKEASAVPGLRKKVTDLEQEVQRLRAATTPAGGAPEQRGGAAKPFEQMSAEEQRASLRRQAAEADGA